MVPPLSKFYHGPVTGWTSTESSPSHNGSTHSLIPTHELPPVLPPRMSAGPPINGTLQSSQGWNSPVPSAPTPSQLYTSSSFASKAGTTETPVDPTWGSGPQDTTKWVIHRKVKRPNVPDHPTKPLLPPRPQQPLERYAPHAPRLPHSRLSTTTIDVPLFLQPVTYAPVSAPPLLSHINPPPQDTRDRARSPPESQRFPPPPPLPPQKIPLDKHDETKVSNMISQRPQYDPQHSSDGGQQQASQRSQRPHFDPQNSHDVLNGVSQLQRQERQPTIPAPYFTSFNVESALPPMRAEEEPSVSPQLSQPNPSVTHGNHSTDSYHAGQRFHQLSISPGEHVSQDHGIAMSKPWGSGVAYIPSPEQQYAVLLQRDNQSISTADFSSSIAGKSTPESQQTSNTSYREPETKVEKGKHTGQGDDSFYWHSGRSSSDAEEEPSQSNSPILTPEGASTDQGISTTNSTVVPRERPSHPTRSTSLSPSVSAPYGASALGFGGPSDWEYFGDYEAEEIDDEDLYSRSKPRQSSSAVGGSVELPAGTSSAHGSQQRSDSEDSILKSQSQLMPYSTDKSSADQPSSGRLEKRTLQDSETSGKNDHTTGMGPIRDQGDVVTDMDEIIRAWSEAPNVGQIGGKAGSTPGKTDNHEHSDVTQVSSVPTPSEEILGGGVLLENAPSVPQAPVSTSHTASLEDRSQHENDLSAVLPDASHITYKSNMHQTQNASPTKATPIVANLQEITQVISAKGDDGVVYKKTSDLEPLHVGRSSKILDVPSARPTATSIEPTTAKTAFSRGHSRETSAEMIMEHGSPVPHHGTQVALHDKLHQELSYKYSQRRADDPRRSTSETTFQGILRSSSEEAVKQVGPESSEPSLSSELGHKNTRERPIDIFPMKPIGNLQEPWQMVGPNRLEKHSYDRPCGPPSNPSQDSSFENPQNTTKLASREVHSDETSLIAQDVVSNGNGSKESKAINTDAASKHMSHEANTVGESQQLITSADLAVHPRKPADTVSKDCTVNGLYTDLDPWGKASLNRFAAMLREESRAESNKDKLNIFNVFTSRESRLRIVLYGTEDDLLISSKKDDQQQRVATVKQEPAHVPESAAKLQENIPRKNGFVKQAVQRANTMSLQRSLKALPALPANRESVVGLPGNALAPLVVEHDPDFNTELEQSVSESPTDGAQYSPGGRPLVARLSREINQNVGVTSQDMTDSADTVGGANDARAWAAEASNALTSPGSDKKKPAYISPKYNEPRSEVKNYLANRKSVIRPYATLTQGSLEGGSTFGQGSETPDMPTINNAITAPTSQYNSSTKLKDDNASDITIKPKAQENESRPDLRRFVKADFDPLLTILPESEAVVHQSARLIDLQNVIENVPDDFSFIHQSVVAWDVKAKKKREENDRQRHARQIESEQRIDSLFDDHEIGYGDISELESEFKRSEAARKADEDRSEYQMFVSDVFDLVWTRLHYELDQLIPHYEQYSNLMNDTLAGRDMFEGSSDDLALAPTMTSFLTLHQKLEIRHQKAFEAVLERDRRLKKTEISPWYTLSNIAKVKQLERQFEDAEKTAIIEYCQQRDARVNRLMDVLDQNTLRGVGANQDYMEAIMKAVKRIASGRAFASVAGSNEPTAGMEEVEKAKVIATQLAISSEQIVQTFHVADMLLNSADYEVSVAKAKVAKADMADLAKLKEERAKEDQKLMRDLEHRLALIREDTRKTNDEIVKLMLFLGVTNGQANAAPAAQAEPVDAEHEARIQKALEEAKKRNTLMKESGG